MPATQKQIQAFNDYRLFEQNPVTFVKSNSAETILTEFNKAVHPIDYDKDPYRGMSEADADNARKLDIITTMLNAYIRGPRVDSIIHNKLTPQFWKEWFIRMTPQEIQQGTKNVFMTIISDGGLSVLADDEQKFRIVYDAYCRNDLDSVLEVPKQGELFKTLLTQSSSILWEGNLSASQRVAMLSAINDHLETGEKLEDVIYKITTKQSEHKKLMLFNDLMKVLDKASSKSRAQFQSGKMSEQNMKEIAQTTRSLLSNQEDKSLVTKAFKDLGMRLILDET